MSAYLPFNRDLNRINDFNERMCQLKTGKYEIVSLLSILPATKHDPRSFTIDLTLYTVISYFDKLLESTFSLSLPFAQETLALITVTGIFCEQNDQKSFLMKEQFMRSFHRTFVITKKGTDGVCIANDMLYVNRLTRAQDPAACKSAQTISKLASRLCEYDNAME